MKGSTGRTKAIADVVIGSFKFYKKISTLTRIAWHWFSQSVTPRTKRSVSRAAFGLQRFMHGFEPWGILFVILALLISLAGFIMGMEDRQSERIFRAWQLVVQSEEVARKHNVQNVATEFDQYFGHDIVPALEYLNRSFSGRLCHKWLGTIFNDWMGSIRRECVIPKKSRVKFYGLYLPRNDLSEAQLPSAVFVSVNLRQSFFGEAYLMDASFFGCDLTEANFSNAYLNSAKLIGADLRSVKLDDAKMGGASFRNSDIRGASLRYSDVSNADFEGAMLDGADLFMTNLAGAKLDQAVGITKIQV